MVTTEAFDPHPDRTRWLRRFAAAAVATAVLGVTGTGLAVAVLTGPPTRQLRWHASHLRYR